MAFGDRTTTSSSTPKLVRKSAADIGARELDRIFFELYSETRALASSSKKADQTIRFFHESRSRLEHELKSAYRENWKDDDNIIAGIAVRHSLLALIYFLYPNYIGYNRLANARQMLQHASTACSMSRSNASLPFAIGLMIQLRITPFLIKSKKASFDTLANIRENALKFIRKYETNRELAGNVGLILDGIGSSYFLLERDPKLALSYLKQSIYLLSGWMISVNKSCSDKDRFPFTKEKQSFFRAMVSTAHWDCGICIEIDSENTKGDQTANFSQEARFHYQRAYDYAKRTTWHIYKAMSAHNLAGTFSKEAATKLERKEMIESLKKAVDLGEESLEWFSLWSPFEGDFLGGSWIATFYQELAKYSEPRKRMKLMIRSLNLAQRAEKLVMNPNIGLARYRLANLGDIFYHNAEYYLQLARQLRGETRVKPGELAQTLRKSLENCLKSRLYYRDKAYRNRMLDAFILAGDISYELMNIDGNNREKNEQAKIAIRYLNQAIKIASSSQWNEKIAESYWRKARVFDKLGKFAQSAEHYSKSHKSYEDEQRTSTNNSSISKSLSDYMLAWTQIEKAKLAHRASEFDQAAHLYSEAAALIAQTRRWQSRSHLYVAESLIEKSEKESLGENTQDAIKYFLEAVQALTRLQSELEYDKSDDSNSFIRLAENLTQFCNARIILEKSKESYKIGENEKSIKDLSLAEGIFSDLAENSDPSDSLGSNEIRSLASLCSALRSFQLAQLNGNAKMYLNAKETFTSASEISKSRTLKPLLTGLANFASFLYYSKQIEESLDKVLDVEKLMECNKALDSAELVFRKLGNKSFLNMLKASKYILDATMKMNAAEREIESATTKVQLYAQAHRSLTRASRYYELLGSSARVKESLRMIGAVKNHQKLIPLVHDIIAEVASNQIIYTAISGTSLFDQSPENSVRDLDSAFVVLDVIVCEPSILENQTSEIEFVMANIGRGEAITVRIDELIPEEFDILDRGCSIINQRSLEFSSRITAGSTNKIKVRIKPNSSGDFVWHPALVYLDSNRSFKVTRSVTARIIVESNSLSKVPAILAEKERLEKELSEAQASLNETNSQTMREKVYSLKEGISEIEENIFRLKNEYSKMKMQLEQIRADKLVFHSQQGHAAADEIERLELEEKLVVQRIERRRSILEQARLL